jgi:deoxyribonuclease V
MEFTEYFYSLVKQIPKGNVSTYGALARALGDIRASRAVGKMLNENPYAPIVPCHRVVMSDGSLGGFGSGIANKIKLLKSEGVGVLKGNIKDFSGIVFEEFETNSPLNKMREEQKRLRQMITLKDDFSEIVSVAGVDVAYGESTFVACAVYDFNTMEVLKERTIETKVDIPYIPTYLAFRELPVISELFKTMKIKPTVLLIDGNGVLHPYGMGIASHVGVTLDIPTIGCAKSLLCGKVNNTLKKVGDFSEIEYEKNIIGYAYLSSHRTKKPIYISPGHKVSFETALEVVRRLCRYKLPEPIRRAHNLATEFRNKSKDPSS